MELQKLAFLLPPETAHNLGHLFLQGASGLLAPLFRNKCPEIPTEIFGTTLLNPVGIAAGFDKNADVARSVLELGFGFIETGSVTARPSQGNPKPRVFRLPEQEALINRMGLPNEGALKFSKKNILSHAAVSIAKTPDNTITGKAAIEDYLMSYKLLNSKGLYTAINVSCPNTEDGKTFEDPESLSNLLGALARVRSNSSRPLLVKFSPGAPLEELIDICRKFNVDGYVVSNTQKTEHETFGTGGLSGKPLLENTLKKVALARELAGPEAVVIAAGGIFYGKDAKDALDSGANLVQMYTGFVYRGLGTAVKVCEELKNA